MTTSFIEMMAETQRAAFTEYMTVSDEEAQGLPGVEVGAWANGEPVLLAWMPPQPRVVESAIRLMAVTTSCEQLSVIGDSFMVEEMAGTAALWKRSTLAYDADMVITVADREGRWRSLRQPYACKDREVRYGTERESGWRCDRFHGDRSLVNTMVDAMVEQTTANRYLMQHGILPARHGVTDDEAAVFSVIVGQAILEEMNCTTRNFVDTDCLSIEAREAIIRWLEMQRSRTAS